MNGTRFNQLLRLFLIGVFIFILSSCATTARYELSKNYSKEKYKRIALLVVRVGCDSHLGCPLPITVDKDYSVRKPQLTSEFNMVFPGQYTAKTDVYIEDEERLRESLPAYPKFAGLKPAIPGTWVVKYYKNITPQIYKAVSGLLAQKGYNVINAKEVAASWPKKISEMKINEIVDALKKDADAVLIMHYADIGYYHSHVIREGGGTYEGFVELKYTLAMFDVNTQERVLHFKKDSPRIADVLSEDPKIINNPELAKKIRREGNTISTSFTDEEIIDYAMNYLCNGFTTQKGDRFVTWWTGLDEIIP